MVDCPNITHVVSDQVNSPGPEYIDVVDVEGWGIVGAAFDKQTWWIIQEALDFVGEEGKFEPLFNKRCPFIHEHIKLVIPPMVEVTFQGFNTVVEGAPLPEVHRIIIKVLPECREDCLKLLTLDDSFKCKVDGLAVGKGRGAGGLPSKHQIMFRFPGAGGFVLEGRVVHEHVEDVWVGGGFEKAAMRAERGGERDVHYNWLGSLRVQNPVGFRIEFVLSLTIYPQDFRGG